MTTIEAIAAEVDEWVDRAQTARCELWSPTDAALKVCEEAGELAAAMLGKGDASEEAADVIAACLTWFSLAGVDPTEALLAVLRKNWRRLPTTP